MRSGVCIIGLALSLAAGAAGAPVLVPGAAPDWEQPWFYTPLMPGGGPGPGAGLPWQAWCAPASAANLVGHWQDTYGAPVGDGVAWGAPPPNTTPWGAASWHDYEADATRPPPVFPVPPVITDHGWYMDTNRLGILIGNPAHAGTYLKDIDTGLGWHFTMVNPAGGWTTGTQGRAFAAGLAPNGAPAVMHPAPLPAFNEIVGEINAGHTMVVSWRHWRISNTGLPPVGGIDEFWQFGAPGPDPWGNHEEWNMEDGEWHLGHAVTAVGYLLAGDLANPRPGTDWVIVHDNVWQTGYNVAVPFNWNVWVANTNAVPEPATIILLGLGALTVRRRR